MKIFVPLRIYTAILVAVALLLTVAMSTFATSSAGVRSSACNTFDSIVVERQFTSKKYKIKLYPNANQQVLFFSASGKEGKIYQLFLFDVDGNLAKQANIKNKQTTVVNNLGKGIYLFEVFSDDERIGNGKLTVL